MQLRARHFAVIAALGFAGLAPAQRLDPVKWSLAVEPASARPGSTVLARVTANIEPGWHLYSLSVPEPIIATSVKLADSPAIASQTVYQPKPDTHFDENFGFNVASYSNQAVFLIEAKLAGKAAPGPLALAAETRYQVCDSKMCLPPRRATAAATLTVDPRAKYADAAVIPAGYTPFDPNAPRPQATASGSGASEQQSPAKGGTAAPAADTTGMAVFLLIAFGFGLAAVFTPCVFPMIPITVSYFLNRPAASRLRSAIDAAVFCLGIMVLFAGLGLAATAILGPFGVVQLGSNVWVNLFVALVFLVFGLSLLGAFEITVPSGVLTKLNGVSGGGGLLGTLLMGLTFSLTAFACVGPFVGTLLAASVQGGGIRPLLGMGAFAAGLALPFFFLALFPAYLKRLPRSGGWMERVKVVMGFLILAAMFKYLASVDQVMRWNILTRERFLAAWVVLLALAGLYLLGVLRLHGAKSEDAVGTGRLLTGALFLAAALSLLPGMFGARLGELDAYVPPPDAASQGATSAAVGPRWMQNQYREALARARAGNKPLLVAFVGYACTNCHWMKANMFTRPEIASALGKFVLVELYTDGTDAASRENQQLQESRFSTVALPYYVILDGSERVLATFPGLTRDPAEFLKFLASPATGTSLF